MEDGKIDSEVTLVQVLLLHTTSVITAVVIFFIVTYTICGYASVADDWMASLVVSVILVQVPLLHSVSVITSVLTFFIVT